MCYVRTALLGELLDLHSAMAARLSGTGSGDPMTAEAQGLLLLAACRALLPDEEQSSEQERLVLAEQHRACRSRLEATGPGSSAAGANATGGTFSYMSMTGVQAAGPASGLAGGVGGLGANAAAPGDAATRLLRLCWALLGAHANVTSNEVIPLAQAQLASGALTGLKGVFANPYLKLDDAVHGELVAAAVYNIVRGLLLADKKLLGLGGGGFG